MLMLQKTWMDLNRRGTHRASQPDQYSAKLIAMSSRRLQQSV